MEGIFILGVHIFSGQTLINIWKASFLILFFFDKWVKYKRDIFEEDMVIWGSENSCNYQNQLSYLLKIFCKKENWLFSNLVLIKQLQPQWMILFKMKKKKKMRIQINFGIKQLSSEKVLYKIVPVVPD